MTKGKPEHKDNTQRREKKQDQALCAPFWKVFFHLQSRAVAPPLLMHNNNVPNQEVLLHLVWRRNNEAISCHSLRKC